MAGEKKEWSCTTRVDAKFVQLFLLLVEAYEGSETVDRLNKFIAGMDRVEIVLRRAPKGGN